jgi:hypothetical protein
MTMLSPLELDLPVSWHREQLLAEADAERLARQAQSSRVPRTLAIRARVSWLLRALADRLEPACCTPETARAHG